MSDNNVVLNVLIEAAPGREKDVEEQLLALIAPTRNEPGCLTYLLHLDPEKPGHFLFYEKFENEAAIEAHVSSEHFQSFLRYRANGVDPVAVMNVTKWRLVSNESQ